MERPHGSGRPLPVLRGSCQATGTGSERRDRLVRYLTSLFSDTRRLWHTLFRFLFILSILLRLSFLSVVLSWYGPDVRTVGLPALCWMVKWRWRVVIGAHTLMSFFHKIKNVVSYVLSLAFKEREGKQRSSRNFRTSRSKGFQWNGLYCENVKKPTSSDAGSIPIKRRWFSSNEIAADS